MSANTDDLNDYVKENRDVLADVLRHSQDPYARACALALLKHGGTDRDAELVKREVDEQC